MSFEDIIQQEIPKQILEQALKKERLANTYLFYGPPGVGKFLLAWRLAQILLCEDRIDEAQACEKCASCLKVKSFSHPDFYLIFPHPSANKPKEEQEYQQIFIQTKLKEPYQMVEYSKPINISVDRIRALKGQIYRLPFQAERKVVIIEQAESIRIDSANLLLKIFEEPPKDTVIILITSQIDRLLPTVVSRCQKIRFIPLKPGIIRAELEKKFGLQENKAQEYASLAEGSLGLALNFASGRWEKTLENSNLLWKALLSRKIAAQQELIESISAEKDRSAILLLLKMWQYYLRDLCLTKIGAGPSNLTEPRLSSRQLYRSALILNQTRLDYFRNINIKSLLIGLCLNLQNTLLPNQEEN